MSVTMKAVRLHAFGGPEVLVYEDAPRPEPGPGEVLVRVRAIGVNPPDWYLREGYRALPPEWRPLQSFPIIPGTDISGVIETVAGDVEGFSAGDAAGAPMSLLTAWQFMIALGHDEPNPVQPNRHEPVPLAGKTVLVNGAAGGVGHFAVQIAKLRQARVIAVASGRNEALLRSLGADEFIDYATARPEEVVRDVDLVIDSVGGPGTGRFLRTLKRGGALFPIFPLGFSGAEEAEKLGVTISATQVRSSGAQLEEVAGLLDDGRLRVVIDSCYPLAETRKAHERAQAGHIQGKIVLAVD